MNAASAEEARVQLLTHGPRSAELAGELARALPPPFRPGARGELELEFAALLDRTRGQLDARRLLGLLPLPSPGAPLLALVDVDLFLPVLTYVFGASELGRGRSVLSLARLAPPGDEGALLGRAVIEAVHELGHGLGLVHCAVPTCPMHRTLWPEGIDLKQRDPCPSCLAAMRGALARAAP